MITGFNVESKEHKRFHIPIEDSYGFDSKKVILAVADGVTRDPVEVLPKTKEEFAKYYPKISPARKASDIFVKRFLKIENGSQIAIKLAFKDTNDEIRRWNKLHIPKPDYAVQDLAGCVASGAVIIGTKFYYGFICDCGIAVFDADGKLKFRTENEGPEKYDKYIWSEIRKRFGKGADWKIPEIRREIRRNYRNNPKNPSFGVLTGQASAMKYVRIGSGRLNEGDILIVYTDGLEHAIYSDAFSHKIAERGFKGLKRLCQDNVRTEGSLVAYY